MGNKQEILQSLGVDTAGLDEFGLAHSLVTILTKTAISLEHGIALAGEGLERFFPGMEEDLWPAVNGYLQEMAMADPSRAVSAAVDLALTPPIEGDQDMGMWIGTNGLTLLGLAEVRGELDQYMREGEKRDDLAHVLAWHMNRELEQYVAEKKFNVPQPYSTLQSYYIVLVNSSSTRNLLGDLRRTAMARVMGDTVQRAVDIVSTYPGCDNLATLKA